MTDHSTGEWWRQAAVYQIYPRSFADANGDGIGDIPGIVSRVDYLAELGIDAVWLSPFYPSALADGGYDVADYRDVDPRLGTLDDFDRMVAALHAHGIRVVVDIVPNHTSDQHEWFQEALVATATSSARERAPTDPCRRPIGYRSSVDPRGSGSPTVSGTSTTSPSSSPTSTGRTPRSAPTS
jgi:alpha-glucosidase